MTLIIKFKENKVELVLKKGNKNLDAFTFPLDNNFDTLLVTSIDKFLKKNRIETSSLKIVKLTGNLSRQNTSNKIAKAVAEAIKYRF